MATNNGLNINLNSLLAKDLGGNGQNTVLTTQVRTNSSTYTFTSTTSALTNFTGSAITGDTVVFPVTSTLILGDFYTVINSANTSLTVNASNASLIYTIPANSTVTFICNSITNTTNAAWSFNPVISILPGPNIFYNTYTTPIGTASTTPILMGLAGLIVPNYSGDIFITINGSAANTAIASVNGLIYYGTGTAPVNGAPGSDGTSSGNGFIDEPTAAETLSPFSISTIIEDLTLGIQYWIDLGIFTQGIGTAMVEYLTLSAFEIK